MSVSRLVSELQLLIHALVTKEFTKDFFSLNRLSLLDTEIKTDLNYTFLLSFLSFQALQ